MERQLVLSLILSIGLVSAARADDPLSPLTAPTLAASLTPPAQPGWHAGAVTLHPGVSAGVTYDDNITLSDTNRLSAFIGSISPSLTAEMGEQDAGGWLSLTYQPTFLIFSDYSNNDTVNQGADFATQWKGAKLTLGASQHYSQTDGAVIEVGQRIKQQEYDTNLSALYAFSDLMSLSVSPRLLIQDSTGYLDSRDWGVDTFLNRVIGAKLTAGVGGTVGYLEADGSPSRWYERLLGQVNYALAEKVNLTATGGAQWLEYDSRVQPVFGLAGTYQLSESTTFAVEGHRRDEASVLLTGDEYLTTGGSLAVQQLFWQRYFVNLTGGYDNQEYLSTTTGSPTGRTDNIYLGRASVGATIATAWNVSVFYQFQADRSNAAYQSVNDNQIGWVGSWGF